MKLLTALLLCLLFLSFPVQAALAQSGAAKSTLRLSVAAEAPATPDTPGGTAALDASSPVPAPADPPGPFIPDEAYLQDRADLDALQRAAFLYMWEGADPATGMAYEATITWEANPLATGGTGFGIAAIVVAVDRGWITRDQALFRLLKIVTFLRDKTQRAELHGAFPHWISSATGRVVAFDDKHDVGADLVETSLLMQGLLIARAYFNGPGAEEKLRQIITELWEDVDWNAFTTDDYGIHWHWTPEHGHSGLKILGFNEGLITYLLAISSPTHPISRHAYDYWTSGKGYQPKDLFGYEVQASLPGGGPLFLTHYSFIGADPRQMSDAFVDKGYFVRNVNHVLSNRAYCLQNAPAKNQYSEQIWGLTASDIKGGYAANEPAKDSGAIGPTGALASMPYTPHYSMQVLDGLRRVPEDSKHRELLGKVWGPYGPYDAFSLRDNWISERYLAIDQLPMVSMVENYRSGLLWDLFMSDKDVRVGLERAGIRPPELAPGFPEAVITMQKKGRKYVPDAFDIRRHPDTGLFDVPYWSANAGKVRFSLQDAAGSVLLEREEEALKGRNTLRFPQFMPPDNAVLTLFMHTEDGSEYRLPLRLH